MDKETRIPHESNALPIDEFYVGYLPMPTRHIQFARRLCVAGFVVCAVLSTVLARLHEHPGGGVWSSGEPTVLEGYLSHEPYPILRVPTGEADKPFDTVLLVEVGKHGARRNEAWNGRGVRVSGWPLQRDGRRMLELEPGEKAIQLSSSLGTLDASSIGRESLGRRRLQGEIIDSKCYLGAMKPGEGKTHKECATLCVAGGIPPMFVTRNESGARQYHLLTNAEGGPMDPGLLPFVADPVELEGEVERVGDLHFFRVRTADVRRR